jgi:AraC-like DNA-binding protein
MENLFKHTGSEPRRFQSPLQVNSIGFVPHKKERVRRSFNSFNFSFILEGAGTYVCQGKVYEVNAPCVITQWPGEPLDYGPDKSWFEIFFIYPASAGEYLFSRHFFSLDKPVWSVSNPDRILKLAGELRSALTAEPLVPDRIDYLCEGMIMESLLAQSHPPCTPEEQKIRNIRSYIRNNFFEKYDFSRLAREHGMSLSTFRRRWLEYTGTPPAKYQSGLIIQEACRLLVEKNSSIKEIAAALNFDDPLYFTKKFHKETGLTPTQYRKQHTQFPI